MEKEKKAKAREKTEKKPSKVEKTEQKEKWIEEHLNKKDEIKKEEKEKKLPTYLIILFIVFGLVAGVTFWKFFFSSPTQEFEPIWEEKAVVSLKLLYSSDCNFCDKENSIKTVFDVRGVRYQPEYIDLAKEENKKMIEEFEVKSLPTALVEAATIRDYESIYEIINASFKKKNGYFVVAENYLDSKPHNVMLLEDAPSCNVKEGAVRIEEFANFYCSECEDEFLKVADLRQKFGKEMDFRFRHFVLDFEQENASMAVECAKRQGKSDEYIAMLFNADADFNKSDINALEEIAKEIKISDLNAFSKCLRAGETQSIVGLLQGYDSIYGRNLNISFLPAFFIDCRYIVVGVQSLKEEICSIRTDLSACSKWIKNY